ncbi:MAG TPA: mechanosensitive ion channel domain-containing protein [Desulfobacteria bacterium]|nr:mechanosensitive ion channel domain-containing protein [Desulfobacteria bacterium]
MAGNKVLIGTVTLESFLLFLFAFILTLIVGNVAYVVVRRLLDGRLSRRNSKLLARATHYAVLLGGIYLGIHHVLGKDLTAFAASLGIFSIALAFSSQQIIQNLIAGLLIAIERPIQLEEWIEVGGAPETGVCKVKDITLTTTVLRNTNGRLIYLPNSALLSSRIINYTKSGFVELPVQLSVPYGSDLEKLKKTILEVANENAWILPNVPLEEKSMMTQLVEMPRFKRFFEPDFNVKMFEPKILIADVSGSKITLSIRIWIREVNKKDGIVSEFLDAVLKRMKEEIINMPA